MKVKKQSYRMISILRKIHKRQERENKRKHISSSVIMEAGKRSPKKKVDPDFDYGNGALGTKRQKDSSSEESKPKRKYKKRTETKKATPVKSRTTYLNKKSPFKKKVSPSKFALKKSLALKKKPGPGRPTKSSKTVKGEPAKKRITQKEKENGKTQLKLKQLKAFEKIKVAKSATVKKGGSPVKRDVLGAYIVGALPPSTGKEQAEAMLKLPETIFHDDTYGGKSPENANRYHMNNKMYTPRFLLWYKVVQAYYTKLYKEGQTESKPINNAVLGGTHYLVWVKGPDSKWIKIIYAFFFKRSIIIFYVNPFDWWTKTHFKILKAEVDKFQKANPGLSSQKELNLKAPPLVDQSKPREDSPQSPVRKRAKLSLKGARGEKDKLKDKQKEKSSAQKQLQFKSDEKEKSEKGEKSSDTCSAPATQSEAKQTKKLAPVAAFHNLGNTCFLSSVLQVLRFTPGFVQHIENLAKEVVVSEKERDSIAHVFGEEGESEILTWTLVRDLHELYQRMQRLEDRFRKSESQYLAIRPYDVLNTVEHLNPMFQGNLQQDAHEFLRCVLAYIQDAAIEINKYRKMETADILLSKEQQVAEQESRRRQNTKVYELKDEPVSPRKKASTKGSPTKGAGPSAKGLNLNCQSSSSKKVTGGMDQYVKCINRDHTYCSPTKDVPLAKLFKKAAASDLTTSNSLTKEESSSSSSSSNTSNSRTARNSQRSSGVTKTSDNGTLPSVSPLNQKRAFGSTSDLTASSNSEASSGFSTLKGSSSESNLLTAGTSTKSMDKPESGRHFLDVLLSKGDSTANRSRLVNGEDSPTKTRHSTGSRLPSSGAGDSLVQFMNVDGRSDDPPSKTSSQSDSVKRNNRRSHSPRTANSSSKTSNSVDSRKEQGSQPSIASMFTAKPSATVKRLGMSRIVSKSPVKLEGASEKLSISTETLNEVKNELLNGHAPCVVGKTQLVKTEVDFGGAKKQTARKTLGISRKLSDSGLKMNGQYSHSDDGFFLSDNGERVGEMEHALRMLEENGDVEEEHSEQLCQDALQQGQKAKVKLSKDDVDAYYQELARRQGELKAGKIDGMDRVRGEVHDCVKQIFEAEMALRTRCLECEGYTERKEEYQDVSVAVRKEKPDEDDDYDRDDPLGWMMHAFSEVERLHGDNKYLCDKCLRLVEAERSMHLLDLPQIFTLHLKRFAATSGYFGVLSKINDHVPTPLELPCLQRGCKGQCTNESHKYELYAVITHTGISISSGHYVAYVKVSAPPPPPPEPTNNPDASIGQNANGNVEDKNQPMVDQNQSMFASPMPTVTLSMGTMMMGNEEMADPNNNQDSNNNIDTGQMMPNQNAIAAQAQPVVAEPVNGHAKSTNQNNSKNGAQQEKSGMKTRRRHIYDYEGRWLECDDETVTVLTDEQFKKVLSPSGSGSPYLLFYKQVQCSV